MKKCFENLVRGDVFEIVLKIWWEEPYWKMLRKFGERGCIGYRSAKLVG